MFKSQVPIWGMKNFTPPLMLVGWSVELIGYHKHHLNAMNIQLEYTVGNRRKYILA